MSVLNRFNNTAAKPAAPTAPAAQQIVNAAPVAAPAVPKLTPEQMAAAQQALIRQQIRNRVNEAKANAGGSRYPRFGRYVYDVLAFKQKTSEHKGTSLIAELKVVESEPLPNPADQRGMQPDEVGAVVSIVAGNIFSAAGKYAAGDIKAILMAAYNEGEATGGDLTAASLDDRQPAVGRVFVCDVVPKDLPPKPEKGLAGKTITNYRPQPIPLSAEDIAQIDAKRAALGLQPLDVALAEARAS